MKALRQKLKKGLQLWKQLARGVDNKLSNDVAIQDLMTHFLADEYGHEANAERADLGYGWLHYGWIRLLKPKRILCVGSRYGFIPAVLAQACKDNGFGRVDFVDPGYGAGDADHWTGVGFWRTERGEKTFERFGLGQYITLFLLTTKEFAKKYKKVQYDYIYIDGDHSFEGVTFDYQIFFPKLHQGGIISFHDISVKGTLPEGKYGVWKMWQKVGKRNAISIENPVSGVGFLQKK